MRARKKRCRVPWRPFPSDQVKVTVPIFVAFCAIAAALRTWNRTAGPVVALLRIDGDEELAQVYSDAADVFLSSFDDTSFYELVRTFKKTERKTGLEGTRRGRAILVALQDQEIDARAHLLADVIISLPSPKPSHFEAALKRHGVKGSPEDIELLTSIPLDRMRDAFLPYRPANLALAKLRTLRQTLIEPPPKPTVSVGVPTLHSLHGFGQAVSWGLELARDIADYKSGKIPWSEIESGVLISGPPGTGKTMYAASLAETCSIPLFYGSAAQWQAAGYLNDMLTAMTRAFSDARSKAPCVLFIDEIDAFGDRSVKDRHGDYKRQVIAGLLEELDGFRRREGVVVIGACNDPDALDPAIKRSGRLGKHFRLSLPDDAARLAIFKSLAAVTFERDQEELVALSTEGMSGADIAEVIKEAKRAARRRDESFGTCHVMMALPELCAIPPEMISSVAVHEAGHAVVALAMGFGELRRVLVMSHRTPGRTANLGQTEIALSSDVRRTRDFYMDEIAMLLAGIAAEQIVFGNFDDGAAGSPASDLVRATRTATLVETNLGMGTSLVANEVASEDIQRLRMYDRELGYRIHDILDSQFKRATAIIQENRRALDAFVEGLVTNRSIAGEDARLIFETHRRPRVSLAKIPSQVRSQ